jgi:hypothetical protein
MMDLKTIIRAARHHEPLKEELGPVQNIVFEMAQGPANAPMAWGAIAAAVVALVFVGITRLSVPSSIQVVSEPSGAEVMVDGVNKGVTPLTVKDIARGRHSVELRQEAYQPKTLTVDIGAFAQRKYSAKLSPVPPKATVAEADQQQPQTLAQIFIHQPPPEKADKKAPAKAAHGKKPVRVASR